MICSADLNVGVCAQINVQQVDPGLSKVTECYSPLGPTRPGSQRVEPWSREPRQPTASLQWELQSLPLQDTHL